MRHMPFCLICHLMVLKESEPQLSTLSAKNSTEKKSAYLFTFVMLIFFVMSGFIPTGMAGMFAMMQVARAIIAPAISKFGLREIGHYIVLMFTYSSNG